MDEAEAETYKEEGETDEEKHLLFGNNEDGETTYTYSDYD